MWLGVRSTEPDSLDSLDLPFRAPPADGIRQDIFSVVVDKGDEGFARPLPVLYFGTQVVHADRRLSDVLAALGDYCEAALQSDQRSVYTVHACRIDGVPGLYARDLFNRSVDRRNFERLGVEFAQKPLVTFDGDRFSTTGWKSFDPQFSLMVGSSDEGGAWQLSGGLVPFTLASFRFGPIGPLELARLVRVCDAMKVVAAEEPADAYHLVRSLVNP